MASGAGASRTERAAKRHEFGREAEREQVQFLPLRFPKGRYGMNMLSKLLARDISEPLGMALALALLVPMLVVLSYIVGG